MPISKYLSYDWQVNVLQSDFFNGIIKTVRVSMQLLRKRGNYDIQRA